MEVYDYVCVYIFIAYTGNSSESRNENENGEDGSLPGELVLKKTE